MAIVPAMLRRVSLGACGLSERLISVLSTIYSFKFLGKLLVTLPNLEVAYYCSLLCRWFLITYQQAPFDMTPRLNPLVQIYIKRRSGITLAFGHFVFQKLFEHKSDIARVLALKKLYKLVLLLVILHIIVNYSLTNIIQVAQTE